MKKFLFLIALFCTAIVSAQNVKVVYELVTKYTEDEFPDIPKEAREAVIKSLTAPEYYDLTYQDGISLYKKQKLTQAELDELKELEKKPAGEYEIKVINSDDIDSGAYQDFSTGEYLEVKGILGKPFLIEDKIVNFDWKLIDEERKIGNFNCKKAMTHYDGDDIIVWYTDELPIPVGPEIYNGLPGLIIELVVDDETHKAISVESLTEKVTIEKPTFEKEGISRDKFSEIEREKVQAFTNQ